MLKPDASDREILRTIIEAVEYRFFGICIPPTWVPLVSDCLSKFDEREKITTVSVVGFPHGNCTTRAKVTDAVEAIRRGAREIDMVMHIGRFKSGDSDAVISDIAAVVAESKSAGGKFVKVIIETGFLDDNEIVRACELAERSGADFVKTSTGFGPRGASVHDVELMNATVGGRLGIKAAGGIRNAEDALALISAGATRIGASASIQLVSQEKAGLVSTAY